MYKYNIDWWCFLVEIVFQLMSARVFFSQCWLDLFFGQCHLEFFRLMLTDDFFDRCRLWLFFSQYQLGFFALNINRYYFLADVDWGYFSLLMLIDLNVLFMVVNVFRLVRWCFLFFGIRTLFVFVLLLLTLICCFFRYGHSIFEHFNPY